MRGLTRTYVIRRVGMYFLTVWLGSTIIFIIPRMVPGDPVGAMISRMEQGGARVENSGAIIEAWRARFGLDAPVPIQYLRFLRNSITFDLGYSLGQFPATVQDMVSQALPWTMGLLALATLISFIVGNLIGALMAWRPTPAWMRRLLPLSLTFTSIPYFMLAILLIYVFGFGIHLLPVSGGYGRDLTLGWNLPFALSVAQHGLLPALSIVIASMGYWALGMRGMMITNAGEDYIILARAKGLSPARLFLRYAVRNAVLPQVTALALTLGSIVGGAVLVEYLFSYPGMGYLLYQGIITNDYTLIQGIVFILILTTATAVLMIDLAYPLVDPRISYQR
ncbi:MAG: ABC transporter permease [Chloroflexi bacterium]|nr:MAG: ABC transporter permease [Chloroflexota bacterium]